jgi:hypothetical protein
MGAFGLRGIHERKQHFIDSIVPGLKTLANLLDGKRLNRDYPEIKKVVNELLERI